LQQEQTRRQRNCNKRTRQSIRLHARQFFASLEIRLVRNGDRSVFFGIVFVRVEDYKSIAQGVVANFGTWSVNEADKTVTTHVDGALFPTAEGTEGKFSASVTADELKMNGGALVSSTWRRFK
jgi:hypothetical protein